MAEIGDMISSDDEGAPLPPMDRPSAPRGIGVRATAMSAALTLVVAGGVATAAYRSTTSERDPASMVPANAFAIATIHLDLPGGQESAVEHILGDFPGVHLPGGGSLKDRVMRVLTKSSTPPVDYDKDIKPWLGDTATFAGWLDNGRPALELVLASTDDAAARSHLPATMGTDEHFVVHDGFVVMGSTMSGIDDAIHAAAAGSLADHGDYAQEVGALPRDEAATAWVNGPAVKGLLQTMFGTGPVGSSMFGGFNLLGATGLGDLFDARLALGVHVTDDYVQMDVRQVGGRAYGTAPSTLFTHLPSTTIGAMELGDPGAIVDGIVPLTRMFAAQGGSTMCTGMAIAAPTPPLSKQARRRAIRRQFGSTKEHCVSQPPVDPLGEMQNALGISFPDDVKTILGTRAVVAFGGLELGSAPDIAIRTHPSDLASAQSLAQTLAGHLSSKSGLSVSSTTAGDDLVLATTPTYGSEIAKSGALGDAPQVRRALGDLPSEVTVAGYVDLSRIWPLLGDHVPAGLTHLKALGLWGSRTGDVQTAQLRLVIG